MIATQQSPLGALFKLPLEIREIIYGYLTPPSRLPTVLRSRHLGVSSVSHRPPPVDALLACKQLYVEALDVYYRKSVFKFDGLLDPANIWPLWQIEEVLGGSELGKIALKNMRKVELNLFWHRLPEGGIVISGEDGEYGSLAITEGGKRIERLSRAVQVLKKAENLKTIALTWKEIPYRRDEEAKNDWEIKEKVLETLGGLHGVKLVAGDIVASDEMEKLILDLVPDLNHVTMSTPKFRRSRVGSRAYVSIMISSGDDMRLTCSPSLIWSKQWKERSSQAALRSNVLHIFDRGYITRRARKQARDIDSRKIPTALLDVIRSIRHRFRLNREDIEHINFTRNVDIPNIFYADMKELGLHRLLATVAKWNIQVAWQRLTRIAARLESSTNIQYIMY